MKVGDTASKRKQDTSKKLLFESVKKKTSYLLNKSVLEETDLYYFVKDFFREYLLISREMSFEEIMQEIEKTYIPKKSKEKIVAFLGKISSIEYVDDSFEEEKIKKYIKEFQGIVEKLPEEEKGGKGFFGKLFRGANDKEESEDVESRRIGRVDVEEKEFEESEKLKEVAGDKVVDQLKEDEKEATDLKDLEEGYLDEEFAEEDLIDEGVASAVVRDEVDSLLVKAESVNDKEELLDIYNQVNKLYEEKDVNEKTKLYPKLTALYERIVKAEEVKSDKGKNKNKSKKKTKKAKRKEDISEDDFLEEVLLDDKKEDEEWTIVEEDGSKEEIVDETLFDDEIVEEDVDSLLGEAGGIRDKDELLGLYGRINVLYDGKEDDEKETIYPKLRGLYERIQNMPDKKAKKKKSKKPYDKSKKKSSKKTQTSPKKKETKNKVTKKNKQKKSANPKKVKTKISKKK